jgi:hypothetical protein
MTPDRSGIAVGCTSCGVDLLLASEQEHELRARLADFFEAHAECHVFVDVSRTDAPLPRPI